MTFLLKLLGGGWLPWLIVGAAAAAFYYFANDYKAAHQRIGKLETDIAQHEKVEKVLREQVKQARDETIASEKFKTAFRADVERVCKAWNKANADGDTDPVGSVLEELEGSTP